MFLESKCWDAIRNRDHEEAVRLLPLVKEPNKIKREWDNANLLHLSSRHGWLDVTKDLITKYHCDPQERDGMDRTCLHWAAEGNHVDVMRYLIDECQCDPMTVDRWGRTSLHWATARWGKCDPLAKDNKGDTPLKLAKQNNHTDTLSIFKKFGGIKSSHPIDSYVNVLLVGNSGAGKSTLSHVINHTATGSIVLGSFRNVGGVVPCTAGIIPYKLQHRTLGNIILHDFAGHSEYYSSHSAVIENLLQGSGGVFLIVVNILEKEPVKQLHQWLTVVRNEAQKALSQCHVIVIVGHVDEISNPVERRRRKEEIQEIIVKERCDSVFLDCRKLGGSGVDSFFNKLSSACESIRSTSGRNLSLYCHMMYGLLEERKENILTLSDVMSAGKNNDDYFIPDKREDVLDVLHSLHSTGLISVLKSQDKVWVVVNKGILLTEVNGILFAPETFKEHVDIASNTGIVSVSGLTRLFPKYDPDILICFLKNMELCQQMNPSFLRMTNLHQLAVEEEEEGGTERRGERPDEMTSQLYQFGWCLQCTSKHHFFPPRYFHVLSLHLAYKMALPQEGDKLNRYCTFWKNGLYWFNGHGVGSLVEIVDESQCVLVMMSCEKGYSDNMVSLRRDVIGEVMSVYKESCPSLEVKELVINPKELAYPVNTPRERTVYSVKAVLSAVVEQRPFLVTTGTRHTELKEILPDESLSDISNLSLLGGRDIKEVSGIKPNVFNTNATTIKLDIKDLDIVIKELTSDQHLSCSVWHRLGLQLGLYDPRLVDIDKKNRGDPVECFRECMSAWLRGEDKVREKEGPSWSSLATALDTIEEKPIAIYPLPLFLRKNDTMSNCLSSSPVSSALRGREHWSQRFK
uniref:Uncharacterized protein n=1 Tax=Amphimedon queenslandica TaxID=400682 RepID=A0A1X7UAD6_AMPQE